ncbi:hypothetical protein [Streptomyces sp. NPDC059604]|uniref:hypothetical protein n=1 Tax=Streptomyces sp. NPDC059604 TaxID=3346881 RepID=UPI0036AEC365
MSRKKKRPASWPGKRVRCSRCGCFAPRDLTSKAAENWSGKWENGLLALILCPPCQTPLEVAATAANEAEVQAGAAEGGRFMPDPVLCITGTLDDPGTVLYGQDHLHRITAAGESENICLVSQLPTGTRCVPMVGGVMVYLPRQHAVR